MSEKRMAELLDDVSLLVHSAQLALLEHERPTTQLRELRNVVARLGEEDT